MQTLLEQCQQAWNEILFERRGYMAERCDEGKQLHALYLSIPEPTPTMPHVNLLLAQWKLDGNRIIHLHANICTQCGDYLDSQLRPKGEKETIAHFV